MTDSVKKGVISVQKSLSSFKLRDVTSFVYGPFASRFWMLRKHTIMMDKKDLIKDAPFYAWDCITLSIKNKWDVYLIIRNEQVMKDFIKLLIISTNSVNGFKNSADGLKK